MPRVRLLFPIALTLLLLVASSAPGKDSPTPPGSPRITVGQFALKVIRLTVNDPAVRDSMTPEEAMARLRKAGVQFKGSANDPLTKQEKSSFFLSMANGLLDRLTPAPDGFEACAVKTSVTECHECCLSLPDGSSASCFPACGRIHGEQQSASPSGPGS
jgi:hypothetical protein